MIVLIFSLMLVAVAAWGVLAAVLGLPLWVAALGGVAIGVVTALVVA